MTHVTKRATKRFAFTKKALQSLPPHDPSASKSNGTEYTDERCPG
ncbi:MAG: integrase, partial [Desulfuromonas sp.]